MRAPDTDSRRRVGRAMMALGLLLPVWAQAANWRTEADVRVEETYTDNVRLVETGKQSDWVTQVAPGLRINGQGARSKATLDGRLQGFKHSSVKDDDRVALTLNAIGQLEAIDNFLFIDADARAAEESISAFGSDGSSAESVTNNRAQFGSVSLAPRAVWRMGDWGYGNLRYRVHYADSDSAAYNSQITHDTSMLLAKRSDASKFGWQFSARSQTTDSQKLKDTHSDSATVAALYQWSRELELNVHSGFESNDYRGLGNENFTTWGAGLQWQPSIRTTLNVDVTRRFFGTGYLLAFTHNRPLSVIRLTLNRDVNTTDSSSAFVVQNAAGQSATLGLQNQNRTLTEAARLTIGTKGVRNTITLDLAHVKNDRLNETTIVGANVGDFLNFGRVIEDSATLTWAAKVTPTATWSNSIAFTSAEGEGTTNESRKQTRFITGLSTRVGVFSNVGLQYRHTRSTGSARYRENALQASLAHRF